MILYYSFLPVVNKICSMLCSMKKGQNFHLPTCIHTGVETFCDKRRIFKKFPFGIKHIPFCKWWQISKKKNCPPCKIGKRRFSTNFNFTVGMQNVRIMWNCITAAYWCHFLILKFTFQKTYEINDATSTVFCNLAGL